MQCLYMERFKCLDVSSLDFYPSSENKFRCGFKAVLEKFV